MPIFIDCFSEFALHVTESLTWQIGNPFKSSIILSVKMIFFLDY